MSASPGTRSPSIAISAASSTVKAKIWRNSPEKVLGVSKRWADANRPALDALLRACYRAAQWCGNTENIEELAGIMAARQYLGVEGRLLLPN